MYRLYVFPGRKPMAFHIALSALVLALVGAATFAYVRSANESYRASAALLQMGQGSLASSKALIAASAIDVWKSAPDSSRLDAVVNDMNRFGRERNIQIASMSLQRHAPSEREVGRSTFTIDAVADYIGFKAWLSDLQGRNPSMAVQSLAIRDNPADVARHNVQLTLILYTRD